MSAKERSDWWTRLLGLYIVAFFVFLGIDCGLNSIAPEQPDAMHTYRLASNHGQVVYLTAAQALVRTLAMALFLLLALLFVAGHAASSIGRRWRHWRRVRRGELRHDEAPLRFLPRFRHRNLRE